MRLCKLEKLAIFAYIREDVKTLFQKSHQKPSTVMSIPNSSSFDMIILNKEPYVGLCFLVQVAEAAPRQLPVTNISGKMMRSSMKSYIIKPHFTSTKLSKCITNLKYQDSISIFRSFISYEEMISARRLLSLLRTLKL